MSTSESRMAEELFAHAGWVRALALRLVRDAAAADDLVQDAFVAALERQPRTDRSLRPWLARVVRRQALFAGRGRARRSDRERVHADEDRATARDSNAGDDVLQRGEAHQRLVNAVMGLRDPYRSVLLLRYFEDLAPREIARRLGVPSATVRSQLGRGLDELRATLDGDASGDRRAWCLPLVPLAVQDSAPAAATSLLPPLLAMHVLSKIALSLSVVAAGVLAFRALSTDALELRRPPADAGVETGVDPVSGAPAPTEVEAVEATTTRDVAPPSESVAARRDPPPMEAPAEAPMTGRIVDRKTGAPVPDFALDVHEGGERVGQVVSDGRGELRSSASFEAGTYDFVVVDREGVSIVWVMRAGIAAASREPHRSSHAFEPGTPIVIPVEVGPTYRVDLRGPSEALDPPLTAWLAGPDAYDGKDGSYGFSTEAPVRGSGASTWVRFQPAEGRFSTSDGPWRLSVESADGMWRGTTEVEPGDGDRGVVARVRLEPRASLAVELATSDGSTLVRPTVNLHRSGEDWIRQLGADPTGSAEGPPDYSIAALAPGTYRLEVRADNASPVTTELELEAGRGHVESIVLEPRPTDAFVRGALTSRSGRYDGRVTVVLRGVAGGVFRSATPSWEEAGGVRFAPFSFDDLPSGRYEILLHGGRDKRRWEGSPFELTAPVDDLEYVCLDDGLLRRVTVHVDVAAGSAPPVYVELAHDIDGERWSSRRKRFGESFELGTVPEDVRLEWCARAEGFRPVWGDDSQLEPAPADADVRIRLQPGWGARLRVVERRADGTVPVAGARLYGDGVVLGETDADGRLALELEREPSRLDVRHPTRSEWRAGGEDYDGEAQRLVGSPLVHTVVFE